MEDKVKPCPWCKSSAQIWHEEWSDQWWIECSNPECDAMGLIKQTEQQAVESWNKWNKRS